VWPVVWSHFDYAYVTVTYATVASKRRTCQLSVAPPPYLPRMTDVRSLAMFLRTVDGLSARRIGARLGVPARTVARWVHGVPVPAWTKRPNAKDDLRERARLLRAAGWSVPDPA
jgi:hypothetical protein